MKNVVSRIGSSLLYAAILMVCVSTLMTACKRDGTDKEEQLVFDTEEYSVPTADALKVVSDLPAYVIPYQYKDFGAALVNRHRIGWLS